MAAQLVATMKSENPNESPNPVQKPPKAPWKHRLYSFARVWIGPILGGVFMCGLVQCSGVFGFLFGSNDGPDGNWIGYPAHLVFRIARWIMEVVEMAFPLEDRFSKHATYYLEMLIAAIPGILCGMLWGSLRRRQNALADKTSAAKPSEEADQVENQSKRMALNPFLRIGLYTVVGSVISCMIVAQAVAVGFPFVNREHPLDIAVRYPVFVYMEWSEEMIMRLIHMFFALDHRNDALCEAIVMTTVAAIPGALIGFLTGIWKVRRAKHVAASGGSTSSPKS